MANVLIVGGGGSGGLSDDTTAKSPQVLEEYTYIGNDTDDEVGTGTMKNLTARTEIEHTSSNQTKVIAGDEVYITDNTDGKNRLQVRYIGDNGFITSNTLFGIETSKAATAGGLTTAKLLQGQSAFGLSGTATSDANATAAYIRQGYTAYVKGQKITGSMVVSSVVSFSVAAYSTDQVIATWQWPSVGPYSGVAICAKTGGYPSNINDGRVYTGTGSSYALGSKSSAVISGLAVGTTYYFRVWTYCTVSGGDIYSPTKDATCTTTTSGRQVFSSSGIFTVPANVRTIQIFAVGGGGGGGSGDSNAGGGAGGGYTQTGTFSVTPGQQLTVTVGMGGAGGKGNSGGSGGKANGLQGGTSSVGSLISAMGGYGGYEVNGAPGGSGGGERGMRTYYNCGGNGGSNGLAGFRMSDSDDNYTRYDNSYGQQRTTREFGIDDTNHTLYSGGGGGAGNRNYTTSGGDGGDGGGGNGYRYKYDYSATAGVANTGGGGGGTTYHGQAPSGGSGIVVIRWGIFN